MFQRISAILTRSLICTTLLVQMLASTACIQISQSTPGGARLEPGVFFGKELFPGIVLLTGLESRFPEMADPYVTIGESSAIVSGTAQYYLKFPSVDTIRLGGPYQIVWNDYYYADGTQMEGGGYYAHSWDMKPYIWPPAQGRAPAEARKIWYGGHMRPAPGASVSRWPDDNFSRDVFAFVESEPGRWFSMPDSIFAGRLDWPRPAGNYLGHRYGHQIVTLPNSVAGGISLLPSVFYEEVTQVRANGAPALTEIFSDRMTSPISAAGIPTKLISPYMPGSTKPYPSTIREDGAVLVEGPLYFRFAFEGEEWEAIGFSAGSYYARYPSCFAARRVSDGLKGLPYLIDLNDDSSDFNDAGADLGRLLDMYGGPGRPSVIVTPSGTAVTDSKGRLQVLVHGYRRSHPGTRVVVYALLDVKRGPANRLRFHIGGS
jgi:hypothetical protein